MGEPDEFAGKQVTVMGLGRFGGGIGVTRFLVDRGADVLVTDKDDAEKLSKSVEQIQDLIDTGRVTLRLGEHNVSDFTTCDLVVVNPAVPPGNRFVRAAEAAGIEVTTEMRLLVQRLPNRLRTIGVTGSAGKSTVTAMIGHVLGKVFSTPSRQDAKTPSKAKVWVGGNIGVSLLPVIDQISDDDWVVLELSSFMLERLKKDDHFPGWSPHIAVITNISPNHLDWHGTMEEYVKAKQQIAVCQKSDRLDELILGPSVDRFVESNVKLTSRLSTEAAFDLKGRIKLPGQHNLLNALIASRAVSNYLPLNDSQRVTSNWVNEDHGKAVDSAISMLADFPGLPHRLQLVAEHSGVRFFNDSKCTTPEAAILAVEAFLEDDAKPGIHLILGGKDKGSDMTSLAAFAAEKCKAVYTIGALGDTIADRIEDTASRSVPDRPNSCGGVSWPPEAVEVFRCGDLDKAVAEIQKRVQPGDVVLLSPACASWDQFENYEQRGERFIELVQKPLP